MTYIYVLRCPITNQVRYVGKADNLKARLRQHIHEARTMLVKSHKCDWIRSVLNKGSRPIIEIDEVVLEGACWKEAERRRVAYYRGLGVDLTNSTNGGEEPGTITERGRRALSQSASQKFGSPEGRKKQSRLMLELCSDPAWLAQRTAAQREVRGTPEWRARQSARSKALWNDPEYRARMKAARAKLNADPAFRAKLSASVTAAQSSPEVRRRKAEMTREHWTIPGERVRRGRAISEVMRRKA